MLDFFIKIPGPHFLAYFTILSIVCITIGKLRIDANDGSRQYPMPKLTDSDALMLAALRGKVTDCINTALFSLWHNQCVTLIEESKETKPYTTVQSVAMANLPSDNISKELYIFCQTPRKASVLHTDATLLREVNCHMESIYTKLEQLHLKRTLKQSAQAWRITVITAAIILSVGLTRLHFGMLYNRPLNFLVILLGIAIFATFAILQPWALPTQLGRNYLRIANQHFAWLETALKNQEDMKGFNPALGVALFGVGILAGVALFAQLHNTFSSASDGDGGGGDGGGGDGGGGDGGGGGCGGCGGGG